MKNLNILWFVTLVWSCLMMGNQAQAYQYFVKSYFNDTYNNLWPARDKVHADYKKVKDMYDDFIAHTSTPEAPPYVQLAKALGEVKLHVDAYDAKINDIAALRKQFDEEFGTKEEIRSEWPNWKEFLKTRETFMKDFVDLNAEIKAMNASANQFVSVANSNGINSVPVKDLQEKIKDALSKLDAAVADARNKMGQAHEAFKKFTATKEVEEKQKAVDQIDLLLGQIDAKRQEIGKEVKDFDTKTAKITKIYQGPGMDKITVFEKLKAKAQEINDISHQVNDQAAKLNEKPK